MSQKANWGCSSNQQTGSASLHHRFLLIWDHGHCHSPRGMPMLLLPQVGAEFYQGTRCLSFVSVSRQFQRGSRAGCWLTASLLPLSTLMPASRFVSAWSQARCWLWLLGYLYYASFSLVCRSTIVYIVYSVNKIFCVILQSPLCPPIFVQFISQTVTPPFLWGIERTGLDNSNANFLKPFWQNRVAPECRTELLPS